MLAQLERRPSYLARNGCQVSTMKLSVQKKADIVRRFAQPNTSMKAIAGEFGVCDKTVKRIVNNKEAIMKIVEDGIHKKRYHVTVSLKFPELNDGVYQWFCSKEERCGGCPITDEVIQTYASRLAGRLNIMDFKASNGWLRSWNDRYNITSRKVS